MLKTNELAELTVNEAIRRYPGAVAVFRRHGIDACCGGAARVTDAAARHGVELAGLLAELSAEVEA